MKEKLIFAAFACVLAVVAGAVAYLAPAHVGAVAIPLVGVVVLVASYLRPPPGGGGASATVLCLALVASGCSIFTRHNARSVLDAAQVACVMSSFLTDASALAKVCDVAEEMLPTLSELVAMRQGAQRSGVKYGDAAAGVQ